MNSADLLKTLRIRGNLTQKNVADALGVTQQAISAVEAGRSTLDVTQLIAVAKLAGHEVVLRSIKEAPIVLG